MNLPFAAVRPQGTGFVIKQETLAGLQAFGFWQRDLANAGDEAANMARPSFATRKQGDNFYHARPKARPRPRRGDPQYADHRVAKNLALRSVEEDLRWRRRGTLLVASFCLQSRPDGPSSASRVSMILPTNSRVGTKSRPSGASAPGVLHMRDNGRGFAFASL